MGFVLYKSNKGQLRRAYSVGVPTGTSGWYPPRLAASRGEAWSATFVPIYNFHGPVAQW